jgi:hypothetical protein
LSASTRKSKSAPPTRGHRDEIIDGGIDPAQGIAHSRQPRVTQLRQRHLAGIAGEQHDPELMFELLDRRRQRRLRDEQPLGGAAVVQLLAQDDEVAQLAQRDPMVDTGRQRFPPRNCNEGCNCPGGLRLKWSLQHLICLGVLFDGVWQAWRQTRAGVGA